MKTQRFTGRILMLGLWLALIVGLVPLSSQAAGPVVAQETVMAEVSTDWWTNVKEDIRTSEYFVTWQEQTYLADLPAAYQAPNRAHNLRTYFAAEGLTVIPLSGLSGCTPYHWRVRWRYDPAVTTIVTSRRRNISI